MTSAFDPRSMSRRLALLAAVTSSLWLAACGGSGDSDTGTTNIRAINLLSDVSSADLYTGDTKRFGPLLADTLASQVSFDANTYSLIVKRTGDAASLFTGSYSLAKDQHYTAVLWGRETAMRVSTLPEDESNTDVTTGTTRVRLLNATIDSGTVDVFLTSTTADLTVTTPTQTAVTAGQLFGFRDISPGTYRLRVTASGDPTDVRMDVAAVTFGDRQFATLVLTAGSGGALLNGTLILQGGGATSMKNTKSRVRLASSIDNSGLVTARVDGTALFSDYRSPRVGSYALIEAGARTLGITVNGSAVYSQPQTFSAGADYTVLAYGPAGASQVSVFSDDNRVPTATNRAKVRLINGIAGSEPLTVAFDYQTFTATSDIAPGTASLYATPTSTGSARLEVTSPLNSNPVFTLTANTNSSTSLLAAQGVYTVFMLSGQTAPAGRFVKDR